MKFHTHDQRCIHYYFHPLMNDQDNQPRYRLLGTMGCTFRNGIESLCRISLQNLGFLTTILFVLFVWV